MIAVLAVLAGSGGVFACYVIDGSGPNGLRYQSQQDAGSAPVNTLFLAYAGAALPLLLLFTQANQAVGSLAGREVIATEIIRSLVGSVGLVSAVPITTWLAVKTVFADPKLSPALS